MARPRKTLPRNGLDIIRKAASHGLAETSLAEALGMSVHTWRRIKGEDDAAREAWEHARVVEEDTLVGKVWEIAMGTPAEYDEAGRLVRAERPPDREALKFLLGARHSYREHGEPRATGAVTTNNILIMPAAMSEEQFAMLRGVGMPAAIPHNDR